MDLATYLHLVWSSPLQVVLSIVFLYIAMGPSVFAGVGVMVLLIPVNAIVAAISKRLQVSLWVWLCDFSRGFGCILVCVHCVHVMYSELLLCYNFQIQQMQQKDRRIRLMNEVLNGIKVIKLYAWEDHFKEDVGDIRQKELVTLRSSAYLNAISAFIWTSAPFLVRHTCMHILLTSTMHTTHTLLTI